MPRRPFVTRPTQAYRYVTTATERAIDQCETSAETGGLHVVEPDVWPPPKKRGRTDGDDPARLRCKLCGCVCLVYPDNDQEQSGIRIVLPDKKTRQLA